MITETSSLVKHYLKENKRIPNPYKGFRNEFGNNIRHPQQLGVVFSDNIIFRRITHSTKNVFDKWLAESELGAVFNKHPYFLRVLNYIQYRCTDYMREGFILRNEHLENGTDKIRPFDGSRQYFMKHLYVLEKSGVIVIDKRQYCNFVWINYDVVGRYPLQDKSRFEMTDADIKAWKLDNRIYDLSKLDQRAKLEVLWKYQMGSKAHYDMFTDTLFKEYVSSPAKSKPFDSGYSDLNSYDQALRNAGFDSRRVRIMAGGETRVVENDLPIQEFEYGGKIMKTGKKHKSPEQKFGGITFEADDTQTIDLDSLPDKIIYENNESGDTTTEPTEVDDIVNHFEEEKEDLPVEKAKPSEIDWDKVDLASIEFDKVDKRSLQGFNRYLASYLDTLFVDGLNQSTYSEQHDFKFRKTFSAKPPSAKAAGETAYYYQAMNMILKNVHGRMIEEGANDQRIRAFLRWSGKNFFTILKHDEMKWYTGEAKPCIAMLSKPANIQYPDSGVANTFHKIYRGLLDKKLDKQNTNNVNSTTASPKVVKTNNQTEIMVQMQQEIKRLRKAVGEVNKKQIEEIEKKTVSKDATKLQLMKEKNDKLMQGMRDKGFNDDEIFEILVS